MGSEQKNILQLVQTGQLKQALSLLAELDSDNDWRDALEIRVLRLLKRSEDAFKRANILYAKNNRSKLSDELKRYIALIFSEQGKLVEALGIYTKICNEKSDPLLLLEYGTALNGQGKLDKAEKQLRLGCQQMPINPNFHSQLGRLYCRSGRVQLGIESYQRAAFLEPNKAQHLQRLSYWSNYSATFSQQANFQMARLWAKKAYPEHQTGSNTWRDANPDKPLKIGIVSGDFCAHAVSFFITPLLKNIQRPNYQVFAYSDVAEPDEITDTIKKYCDQWHDASGQSDDLLGAQMGADQLDILIDLSGHSANNRLGIFSQHIAPIQISWLGYPSTTGLDSIQYRITDNIADPDTDKKDYFTEELIRLKNCFLCYEPYHDAPAIKKTTTTVKSKKNKTPIRFGSFNNLAKISATTLDAWASVLQAVPESTLYIKRQQLINKNAKKYLIDELMDRGITKDRLILKTSKAKIKAHLSEYNEIDIALDTTPYNGTTTTLESLWMGTPVLTLSGNTHASRVSASILTNIELNSLITHNIDEFTQQAVKLSKDKKQLIELSESLRDKLENSALLNHASFAELFCHAIREKWQLWCYTRNKEQGIELDQKIMGDQEINAGASV